MDNFEDMSEREIEEWFKTRFCEKLTESAREGMGWNEMDENREGGSRENFGFAVETCAGTVRKDERWVDTWEELIGRFARSNMRQHKEVHRKHEGDRGVKRAVFGKVNSELDKGYGRWDGREREDKASVVSSICRLGILVVGKKDGELLIFDAVTLWGHNECK